MSAVYSLEREERDSIEKLFENVPQLVIADELRKKLDEFTDKVMDEVTDYMKDEYVLRFEEIALSQAKKIVIALLKGDQTTLEVMGLAARETVWGRDAGVMRGYDSNGVRAKIVGDNIESIQNAEIIELRRDLEQAKKDLAWERQRNR